MAVLGGPGFLTRSGKFTLLVWAPNSRPYYNPRGSQPVLETPVGSPTSLTLKLCDCQGAAMVELCSRYRGSTRAAGPHDYLTGCSLSSWNVRHKAAAILEQRGQVATLR